MLIPDEGDAKLLTPEEFASAASDFDQALIVKVAYKTVQTAYKIAKEKQSDISNDTTEGTDVDEADESTTREHVMKQKQSVEKAFKNRKAIEETVSTFLEEAMVLSIVRARVMTKILLTIKKKALMISNLEIMTHLKLITLLPPMILKWMKALRGCLIL